MDTQSQINDDGSVLTWSPDYGVVSATAATGDGINSPVAGWNPSSANPAATSWDQVLQLGFTRAIDAITRAPQLSNAQPVLQKPALFSSAPVAGGPAGISPRLLTIIIVGALIFAFAKG